MTEKTYSVNPNSYPKTHYGAPILGPSCCHTGYVADEKLTLDVQKVTCMNCTPSVRQGWRENLRALDTCEDDKPHNYDLPSLLRRQAS